MRTARVIVTPYNAAWATEFERIKKELAAALGDLALGIEHVGSTAVEGMSAKPCIDLDVIIKDELALSEVVSRLASIGYVHEGDLGIKGREAFKYTDKPHLMSHHLYVCAQNSAELHRHLTFRDFLRGNPEAVEQYSRVKERAAALYPNDIDGYIAYKSPCIAQLYAMCGLEQTERKTDMKRVYDFLKKAEVYYLATAEGDQPRVRPFGTVNEFEGKLYIQTGKIKPTSRQLAANHKAELCAFCEGAWLRVACELIEDDRFEAKKSMLDAYPNLRRMYDEKDGNTQVFYMQNATATFCAFGKDPEVVKF